MGVAPFANFPPKLLHTGRLITQFAEVSKLNCNNLVQGHSAISQDQT